MSHGSDNVQTSIVQNNRGQRSPQNSQQQDPQTLQKKSPPIILLQKQDNQVQMEKAQQNLKVKSLFEDNSVIKEFEEEIEQDLYPAK
ncbi:unnamed protein product [Paramecium octaurelia]|uniref:Uncharacterized protein n=1 Tax=Paramecium octaurelia TaxID=43137 RepID=A0A8S1YHX9_PAROT|nr:unnamed protein product [Paramecium octaurelia]